MPAPRRMPELGPFLEARCAHVRQRQESARRLPADDAERLAVIRDLRTAGCTNAHIARVLGLSEDRVKELRNAWRHAGVEASA